MAGELREARQGRDAAVIANADLAQISIEYRKKMSAAVAESGELAAEVERLTKERDEARAGRKLMSSQGSDTGLMFMGAQAERDAAESSLAEALKALEPFAKEAKYFDEIPGVVRTDDNFEIWQSGNYRCPINAGHLREARRLTLGRDGEGK
jgi:endo-1,4-beta-D-glucanase Y